MTQKLKKFFSPLFKKKTPLLLPVFVFWGLFCCAQSASAGWIEKLATNIATWPILFIIKLIAKLMIFVVSLAGSLLNWVLSPDFIDFSYTNPARNPIIEMGLGVTQGFVNMILVLVLVYIGIATILRLAGYETKKLLVTFILIALLVNFSPVICGLIVDASNIVMNFFIQDLKADAFAKNIATENEKSLALFEWEEKIEDALGTGIEIIVLVVFLAVLTLILFIFTLIFALRYLVIWLLVILSPIAFACYILPATKKYWTMWWNQFIQWSIIGITCGFFLYLGLLFVTHADVIATPETEGTGLFDNLIVYIIPIFFLGVGLVFGLQTSAMGAEGIIKFAKKEGKQAAKKAGGAAKWTGRRIKERGIKPALERVKLKETAGVIARGVEKVPVARWFLPEKLREYGQMRPAIDEGKKKAASYSSGTLAHRILKQADTQTDATGNLLTILERGDAEDLFHGARKLKKWKGKTDQEILEDKSFQKIMSRPLDIAQKGGLLGSDILRTDPRLAKIAWSKKIGPYGKRDEYKTGDEAVAGATREARRKNINQMEKEVFEDETVVETMMEKGREFPEAVVAQVKLGQETTLETMDKLFSQYLKTEHPVYSKIYKKLGPELGSKEIKEKLKDLTPEEIEVEVRAKVKSDVEADIRKEFKELPPEKIKEKVEERMKTDKIKESIGKETRERKKDPRSKTAKAAYDDYREHFKTKHRGKEGYFRYLEGRRAREMGWRPAQYYIGEGPTHGEATMGPKPEEEEKQEEKRKERERGWKAGP